MSDMADLHIFRGEVLYGLTEDAALVLDRCGDPVAITPIIDGEVLAFWHTNEPRPHERP